jgi:GT2 family glycosyltransferase
LICIIIVTWNTADLIEDCLASIFASPPTSPFEVWVVDNASTDGSSRMVRERFPQVHLVRNSENVGFARANNQAIKQSAGQYVLLLNPDTLVAPGTLQTLLDFLERHPQAGAVGPRTLNPDGSLQVSAHRQPTLSRELWRLFHLDNLAPHAEYRRSKWNTSEAQQVEVLKGACLLLRREVLEQVGLLDEDYFMYSEEVDLCYRVRRAGWRLFWVPESDIVHLGAQSTKQVPGEMFLNLYRGKIKYFRKHHRWPAAQIYKLILIIAALSRLVLVPLVVFERSTRRHIHIALADRYRRLVVALPRM